MSLMSTCERLHEIIDCLGGQAKKPVHAARPRLRFGVLHELGADSLVLVLRIDADAGQFRLVLVRIGVQRQAGYLGAIDLEDKKILYLAINLRAGAAQQLIVFYSGLNQGMDRPRILLLSAADRLVFVGMDQRADPFVGEDLGQQAFLDAAVNDVHARHTVVRGTHRVLQLRDGFRGHLVASLLENDIGLFNGQLPQQFTAAVDARMNGQINQLDGTQRLGDLDRDGVGVQPVGIPLAVAAQGWNNGNDIVVEERLKQVYVHALHASRELVVDAV